MTGLSCLLSCNVYLVRSGKNCVPSYGEGSDLVLASARSFSLMSKKLTLIRTSLGTDAARWGGFAILCILSMLISLGEASGRIVCMSSFSYLGRSAGRMDSGIPCSLTLLRRDLSSKSVSLALTQYCFSFTSSSQLCHSQS